jgi:hypothetical protein
MPNGRRVVWLRVGALVAGMTAGCAQPYPTPNAVIVEFHPDGTRAACVPVSGPLDARIGAPVPVTAACSEDPGGGSLVYSWSLVGAPAGSMPVLGNTESVTPTFVPDAVGSYRLRLVVSNGVVTSAPTFANVVVGACGGHAPALGGITMTSEALETGDVVSLAAAVTDADTEPSCGAHAALPAGSRASLNDAGLAEPSFVPDVAGKYALAVTVTDPTGRSATATQAVTVAAGGPSGGPDDPTCGRAVPVAVGRVLWPGPVALCGGGVMGLDLDGTDAIELDANASSDRDNRECGMGQSLDYAWTLALTPISGGKSALESRDGASTVLRVTSDGIYRVKLVVRDSTGLASREQFCQLHVKNVGAAD